MSGLIIALGGIAMGIIVMLATVCACLADIAKAIRENRKP